MPEPSIRSIRRCFKVLELFDTQRAPMSATMVARLMNAPLSSTLDLLKSMSSLGYVTYDSRARSYFPSLRVALLGGWIQTSLMGDMSLIPMLEHIAEATGETVSISAMNDLDMQYLWVVRGSQAISLSIAEGQTVPIFTTSIGHALIARWSDAEIAAFLARYRRRRATAAIPSATDLRAQTDHVRSSGHAAVFDGASIGVGSVAIAIPLAHDRNLAISVGGPTERIRPREREIAATMRRVAHEFGH